MWNPEKESSINECTKKERMKETLRTDRICSIACRYMSYLQAWTWPLYSHWIMEMIDGKSTQYQQKNFLWNRSHWYSEQKNPLNQNGCYR